MQFCSVRKMRELDRRTISEMGVSGDRLMERAGRGTADCILRWLKLSGRRPRAIHLAAGSGNNGGDAFVVARLLQQAGLKCRVWILGASAPRGESRLNYRRMLRSGVTVHRWRGPSAFEKEACEPAAEVIQVDGLLGTGTSGAPREPAAGMIRLLRERAGRGAWTVSIDIPSGLNGDSGMAGGEVVRADVTVTMGLPKPGLLRNRGPSCSGRIEVIDLGFSPAMTGSIDDLPGHRLITPADLRNSIDARAREAHKGDFGHVLLVGGAQGYSGAITMAAMAALRSGVGLVSVACPRSVQPLTAGAVPEAMVHGMPETPGGSLADNALAALDLCDFDAVLLGPGMTAPKSTRELVQELLARDHPPLLLDADALNVLAGNCEVLAAAGRVLITPHPGELARLLNRSIADIQADRPAAAAEAVKQTGATVVLKGAGTLVAAENEPLWHNSTGNPGMACGGSGDVLAGLAAGLLAAGRSAADAARLAVWLHGTAGDIAAGRNSQPAMKAGDLVSALPGAWSLIAAR